MRNMRYKSKRIIDGKLKWVIIDENRNVINREPSKEELICIEKEIYNRIRYTDEELLEYLRLFNKEKGRTPKTRDFYDNIKYPSSEVYRKRFGSWNKALVLAKLQVIRPTNISDEELLESLIHFSEENGRSPKKAEFNNNSRYPNYSMYQRRFGSWSNSLRVAGLRINNCLDTTDDELLEFLVQFFKENGRSPTQTDFNKSRKYPNYCAYRYRFGGWQKALKLVGLDIDSMVKKGIVETSQQKARLSEIYILNHFNKKGSIDLSGNNCKSPFDGICPEGETYDVKSSSLLIDRWIFDLDNTYREDIKWLYLCAFDKYYNNLLYVWRVPSTFTDQNKLYIELDNNREFNIKNMEEYDITEKFKEIQI